MRLSIINIRSTNFLFAFFCNLTYIFSRGRRQYFTKSCAAICRHRAGFRDDVCFRYDSDIRRAHHRFLHENCVQLGISICRSSRTWFRMKIVVNQTKTKKKAERNAYDLRSGRCLWSRYTHTQYRSRVARIIRNRSYRERFWRVTFYIPCRFSAGGGKLRRNRQLSRYIARIPLTIDYDDIVFAYTALCESVYV